MIKKICKWIFVCFTVFAVLAAATLFTLYKMYPPEKLKTMAQAYVAKNFQREIAFDDISFSWIGFTLHNFALSENATFAQGTFIRADRLTAHVAVKPLLKKRIEVSTIEADNLQVNLVLQKNGTFNFATLMPQEKTPSSTADTGTSTEETPFVLTAEKITLADCDFVYKNEQTGLRLETKDINLKINQLDLDQSFETIISFTTDISGTGQPDMTLPVTLRMQTNLANLDLPYAYAKIDEASARYKSTELKLQGEIKNFESPGVNLNGTLTGVDNKVLSQWAPDLPNFTLPTINLALHAATNLTENTAQITEAKLSVKNSFLSTNGNINWGGNHPSYALAGTLAANLGEIVQMTDTLDNFSPAGIIKGTFKASDKKEFKDVNGTIELKDINLLYPPFTLTQTNGTVNITSLDNISSQALKGKLNGENFKASFSYKNLQNVLNLGLNLELDKLVLDTFSTTANNTAVDTEATPVPAETAASQTATRMNIQAQVTVNGVKIPYVESDGFVLNANLTEVTDSMAQANGTLDFTLKPGKITNLDNFIKDSKVAKVILLPISIVKKVAGILKIDLFPANNKDGNGTTLTFTQAEGAYQFTNGEMRINKTAFHSTVTDISATGTANFKTDALDMKAKATLLTQAAPVSFKITGTISNPKGKLDVVNTVTSVVGGLLNGTAVKSTANGSVNLTKNAADTAGDAVKGTVHTAADIVKGIGGLFKKKEKETDTL